MKLFIFVITLTFSSINSFSQEPNNYLVNVNDLKELFISKSLLIDVRTPEEFQEGTIENAINLNFYEENFNDEVEKLDRHIPVVLFCKAGGRSAQAYEIFKQKGFKNIKEIDGGYDAWSQKAIDSEK